MKKLLQTAVCALALTLTAPSAGAGDNAILVELFTSQGCSSCPPADETLAALTERADVLPLSMHVDYWDYLGWRDTFAKRELTERQFAYRELMGARVVYTPQMIIHGVRDVPGYRAGLVEEAIRSAQSAEPRASIALNMDKGMLSAQIEPAANTSAPSTVWIASFSKEETVEIHRGENAGERITYHNVVEDLIRVGAWSGDEPRSIEVPQPEDGKGVAVWLQDERTGQVIAASYTTY
jgi:hypothetical protein